MTGNKEIKTEISTGCSYYKDVVKNEILIDGVDVAGCEFCKPNPLYKIEYACHCRGYIQDDGLHVHLSCEHNPNCYYKQLKRFQEKYDTLTNKFFNSETDKTRLKQENEQLKKEIASQKGLITVGGKQQYEMTLAYDRYKSALEEIWDIVKCYEDLHGFLDCTFEVIEKEINEVLNEN